MRVITCGSKVPANRSYSTRAILLEEEAIRLCPTFHLQLTFMSSTQFYHSPTSTSHQTAVVRLVTTAYTARPPNHRPQGPDAPQRKPKSRLIRDPLWPLKPSQNHAGRNESSPAARVDPVQARVTFESRLPELADPAGPLGVRSLI